MYTNRETSGPKLTCPKEGPLCDCGTELRRASELIDHFIKPLANKHPSYLKDTYDFLDKIGN